MIRVTELPKDVENGAASTSVAIPMTSEDRMRVRRRLTASDGVELGLSLATGTNLAPGTVIHADGGKRYVVEAAPEDCVVVTPRDLAEATTIGHIIGNLHRSLHFTGGKIVALWDAPLEKRLRNLGFDVIREERPFLGRPNHGHSH